MSYDKTERLCLSVYNMSGRLFFKKVIDMTRDELQSGRYTVNGRNITVTFWYKVTGETPEHTLGRATLELNLERKSVIQAFIEDSWIDQLQD